MEKKQLLETLDALRAEVAQASEVDPEMLAELRRLTDEINNVDRQRRQTYRADEDDNGPHGLKDLMLRLRGRTSRNSPSPSAKSPTPWPRWDSESSRLPVSPSPCFLQMPTNIGHRVLPCLLVSDMRRSLDFYIEMLGFTQTGYYPIESEPIRTEVRRDDVAIILYSEALRGQDMTPTFTGALYIFPERHRPAGRRAPRQSAIRLGPGRNRIRHPRVRHSRSGRIHARFSPSGPERSRRSLKFSLSRRLARGRRSLHR